MTNNQRAAFEAWLRVKPCGAAHDFAWEAWQAALASQEVQALREALQVMIETAERVDGWQSFPNEPIEKARAALAAMEKQT